MPIAAGERADDLRDCQRLISAGVSVLQPDVIHLGGISKMVAAAELCEAASVSFAPHNASGRGMRQRSSLRRGAGSAHAGDVRPLDTEWKDRVALPAVEIRDGYVTPLKGTGLGISLDVEEMARHPYAVRDMDLFGTSSILSRPVRDDATQHVTG